VNGSRLAAVFVGAWCLVLIPLAINLLRRSRGRQLDPATRLYHEFCRKLRSADLARGRSEAPGDFALRVSLLRPELAAEVESISRAYDAICYRDQGGAEAIDLLKKQVRKFNPR
jgi:hypothetical protein